MASTLPQLSTYNRRIEAEAAAVQGAVGEKSARGVLLVNDEHSNSIDRLVSEFRRGGPDPTDELVAIVYDELRHWARIRLSARNIKTMGSGSLVNEALMGVLRGKPDWQNKRHVYGVFIRAINNRLVDYMRKQRAPIHGGDQIRTELTADIAQGDMRLDLIVELHESLQRLEDVSPRAAKIVRERFYGGMTFEEIAAQLDCSVSTVRREWIYAKSFLFAELSDGGPARE